MPNSSQSSFIPKNNLPNRQKVGRRYNLFFVSLVVYGLFIATPIASAVVFIYEKHTKNVINQVTRDLDSAIKSFSESDLLAVAQFDSRLVASSEVLDSNVPVNSLLQFFLQNAPRTVSFSQVMIEAAGDGMVAVTAKVESESFDYVIFYRDELLRNSAFSSSEISKVTYQGEGGEDSSSQSSTAASGEGSTEQNSKLSYEVKFTVPISFFNDYTVADTEVPIEEEVPTEVSSEEEETEPLSDNTNNQ